ncbi:MFS transporter, partial [Salmonella enterica subsp. enterica serovar Typhimurium]|nr:MFS transporter [Salmonella enterica subsp. enterica serovar Typhimurium]
VIVGILQLTQNFQYAMWYIACVAGLGLLAYIFLVGKIEVILPEKKNADTVDKNAINPATANK